MSRLLLEDVRQAPDEGIEWHFLVEGDTTGVEGAVTGGLRRWIVATDRGRPVVVRDAYRPAAPTAGIPPEPALLHAFRQRIHEELVRAELARLLIQRPESEEVMA